MSRIAEFAGHEWGLNFAYFGAALFECTGFVNVLLYTSTRKGIVSWNRLAFWRRDEKDLRSSSGRVRRWTARDTPEDEMVDFDSVPRARIDSKSSASSIAALKEEISRGVRQNAMDSGGESDQDSHLDS